MTVDPAALTGNGAGSSSNGNGFTYFDCNVCGRAVRVFCTLGTYLYVGLLSGVMNRSPRTGLLPT